MEEFHKQFFLKTNLFVKAANSIKTSFVEPILYDKRETMATGREQAKALKPEGEREGANRILFGPAFLRYQS
jgi:hypothetical protein